MDPKEFEAWNERMAQKYDPNAFIMKSGFLIRWVEAMRLNRAKQALQCQPHDNVLDVGCGAGHLLGQLIGSNIVGVDLSETLLAVARDKLRGRANIEIRKGNAENLPFPDSYFDRVVCSEVLEHLPAPENVLKEIHRVSKPGARVVITLPYERLINVTKRVVLRLGLKKWLAGDYKMSDNMLEEWHVNEISREWVLANSRPYFHYLGCSSVPLPIWAYHHVFSFRAKK